MWNPFRTGNDVSVKRIMKKLAAGWEPYLVDVRSKPEVEQSGVVSGCSLSHPHDSISKVQNKIPKDRDVLLMCKGGFRSLQARKTLIGNGFDKNRLFNMVGGITAWKRLGGELEKYSE